MSSLWSDVRRREKKGQSIGNVIRTKGQAVEKRREEEFEGGKELQGKDRSGVRWLSNEKDEEKRIGGGAPGAC